MRPQMWKVASDSFVEKKAYFTLMGSASLQNRYTFKKRRNDTRKTVREAVNPLH